MRIVSQGGTLDRDIMACDLGTATCIHPSTTLLNGRTATPLVTEKTFFKNLVEFSTPKELRT